MTQLKSPLGSSDHETEIICLSFYSGITESRNLFRENCTVCHGENLEGAPQGSTLCGDLSHGESMSDITASITNGYELAGMPTWRDIFSPVEIKGIALYVLETRANVGYKIGDTDNLVT